MNLAYTLFRFKNQVNSIMRPRNTAQKMARLFLSPNQRPLKAWEHQAEQAGQRFQINEQVSAIRWLPATTNQGQPKRILLVHGWESRATQMYGLVPDLLALGFEVTALDMPLHGHSKGHQANPYVFAQTILLAQQELGEFEGVIAHSMGAAATAFSLSNGLNTQKVILVAGPSCIANTLHHFAGLMGLNNKTTRYFLEEIEKTVGIPSEQLDVLAGKQDISIPILVVHDETDREIPFSESQRMVSAFSQGELLATQGLGHRKIIKSDIFKEKMLSFFAHLPQVKV